MAAKAMSTAMEHIKPFFTSGEIRRKGTFVIGTVASDLHDIGKILV
jgi:methanogenic corrinoid protein MtbC1